MKSLRSMEIADYVNSRRSCTIAELIARFKVSHATIHRDVSALVNGGLLRRVRGGVAALPGMEAPSADRNIFSRYQDRLDRNADAKTELARKAIREVEDGDILFLDSSTTVYYLAKELEKTRFSNLTIITNSLLIIQEFSLFPTDYFLVALGGNYDPQLNAFLGQATMNDLERLKIGKAFISALGVCDEAIFSRHENHSYFLRRVLEIAARSTLLLTPDKFGKSGLFEIAPLSAVDSLITLS